MRERYAALTSHAPSGAVTSNTGVPAGESGARMRVPRGRWRSASLSRSTTGKLPPPHPAKKLAGSSASVAAQERQVETRTRILFITEHPFAPALRRLFKTKQHPRRDRRQ